MKSNIPRVLKNLKKGRYPGKLQKADTMISISNLKDSRRIRTGLVAIGATVAPPFSISVRKAVDVLMNGFFAQPAMTKENMAASAVAGAAFAGFAHLLMRENVRQATYNVGAELHKESKQNPEMMKFLKQHKYVIIDRKGRIAGTNFKRILGFGRLRMETKKIIDGKYEKGTI